MAFCRKQLVWSYSLFLIVLSSKGSFILRNDTDDSKMLPSRVGEFVAKNAQQSQDVSSLKNFTSKISPEFHQSPNEDGLDKTPIKCSSDSENCKVSSNIRTSQIDNSIELMPASFFPNKTKATAINEQNSGMEDGILKQENSSSKISDIKMLQKPIKKLDFSVFKELFLKCLDKEFYERFYLEKNKVDSDGNFTNISKLLKALCHKAAENSKNASCSFKTQTLETDLGKTGNKISIKNLCFLLNTSEVNYMINTSLIGLGSTNLIHKNLTMLHQYFPLRLKKPEVVVDDVLLDEESGLPHDSKKGIGFRMFYWTYVSAFLYGASYLTSFLFSRFSIPGLVMNLILFQFFPDIIQSPVFQSFDLALSALYSSL
ncbi:uncharacterized protein LOC135202242 [Macrobrachium nipponense]|uniref:uncharacterized protein LOC135202242 n=1 Tax=Macrobrachium nipponense TaxID=159736 RepID=UPI0030C7C53F